MRANNYLAPVVHRQASSLWLGDYVFGIMIEIE